MTPWVAIPLSGGGFALVDRRDAERVRRHFWRSTAAGVIARIRGRATRLARFIISPGAGARVRNRSGDAFDCRRQNLSLYPMRGRAA